MTLHIYQPEKTKRIRRNCPYHKYLCYGEQQDFYDTRRVFFDCGTMVDYGYREWTPPPKKKCPQCRKWFRPKELKFHLYDVHRRKP